MHSPHAWNETAARDRLAQRRALRETRAVLREADAAYRGFGCPATAECCQLATSGREPWLWPEEWALLADAARTRAGTLPPPRADGGCPFLDAAGRRCTVYADRPLGCRTFFCHRIQGPGPEPREALNTLSRRLERVAHERDPDCQGPKPLTEWHRAAGGVP